MTSEPDTSSLRPEAMLLTWNRLSDSQRGVIKKSLVWLNIFLSLDSTQVHEKGLFHLPAIDAQRHSNVILIDGRRGFGKTTALLFLVDLWGRLLRGEPLAGERFRDFDPTLTANLGGRLLPLRILDLQSLPRDAALLPWLASAVHEAIEALEGSSVPGNLRRSGAPERWHPDYEQELPSRKHWNDFVQAFALGWNSSLRQRNATLDPETYAKELEESARNRLTVAEQWRLLIDALVSDMHARHRNRIQEDVRLVLAIDDADMNPHHVDELLDLLRTLWHPKVVFLLTGDSNMFLDVLRHHVTGRLKAPLRGLPSMRMPGGGTFETRSTVRELMTQIYAKAIPPAQRFQIQETSGPKRREVAARALQQKVKSEPPWQGLHTFLDWFGLLPELDHALPSNMRSLQDFSQTHASSEPDPLGIVRHLWQGALEDGELEGHDIRKAIALADVEEDAVTLTGPSRISVHVTYDNARILGTDMYWVVFRRISGETALPTLRLTSAYCLVVAIASGTPTDGQPFSAIPFVPGCGFGPALFYTWQNARVLWTWPQPRISSPVLAKAFSEALARKLADLRAWAPNPVPESPVAGIARWFVGTVVELFVPSGSPAPLDALWSWEQIAVRLEEVGKRPGTSPDARALRQWAEAEAILLAAPESGLEAKEANAWLHAWKRAKSSGTGGPASMPRLLERVAKERRTHGRAMFQRMSLGADQSENFLLKFDERCEDHQWSLEIEGAGGYFGVLRNAAQERLFSLTIEDASGNHNAVLFKSYVDALGLKEVFDSASPRTYRAIQSSLETFRSRVWDAAHAIAQVWNAVLDASVDDASERERLRGLVQVNGMNLQIEDCPYETLAESPITMVGPTQGLGVMFSTMRLQLREEYASLPPVVPAMLAVAWDMSIDQRGIERRPQSAAGVDCAFAGTVHRYREKDVIIPWAFPDWAALRDRWGQKAWIDRSQEDAGVFVRRDDLGVIRQTIDHFVAGLIQYELSLLQNRRSAAAELSLTRTTFNGWVAVVSSLRAALGQVLDTPRKRSVSQWFLHTIALLGMPEIGLSDTMAKAVLGAYVGDAGHGMFDIDKRRNRRVSDALCRAGITDAHEPEQVRLFLEWVEQRQPSAAWGEFYSGHASTLRELSASLERARQEAARASAVEVGGTSVEAPGANQQASPPPSDVPVGDSAAAQPDSGTADAGDPSGEAPARDDERD